MPVPSQGHCGFPSFPVVDWFCLFVDLWVLISNEMLNDVMSKPRLFNPYLYSFSIFTLWKSIVYYRLCRDRIFFDKILVSEYKLLKWSNKAKRDDFNFKIINFPNMRSNISASPAYGVYISQLIRYARASSNYSSPLSLQRRNIFRQDLGIEYKPFKRSNKANLVIALVQ
jgi:hypothetical protein